MAGPSIAQTNYAFESLEKHEDVEAFGNLFEAGGRSRRGGRNTIKTDRTAVWGIELRKSSRAKAAGKKATEIAPHV